MGMTRVAQAAAEAIAAACGKIWKHC